MARTLSAPRGSGFAGLAAYLAWQKVSIANSIAAGRHDPHRALLVMVAVALVIAGAAVPHLDDESLSTLLFLAGTGLAAAILRSPGASATRVRPAPHQTDYLRSRLPKAAHLPARFSELIARQTNPTIDRAAWAKLTAHMSHELRTPLNAVLGFSEMMSNEVFGPLGSSLYTSYARDIHASGRLLLKSAEDALAITSLLTAADRKGSYLATNLRDIVADAALFAEPDLKARRIALDACINNGFDVAGEPQAVRQVLINLLAEASARAADGATIAITACAASGIVSLSIEVAKSEHETAAAGGSFPLMLARTLCELSGAKLACRDPDDTVHGWTIDFAATAQNDLFV